MVFSSRPASQPCSWFHLEALSFDFSRTTWKSLGMLWCEHTFTFPLLHFSIFPEQTLSSSVLVLEIRAGSCYGREGCNESPGHLLCAAAQKLPFQRQLKWELGAAVAPGEEQSQEHPLVVSTATALSAELKRSPRLPASLRV